MSRPKIYLIAALDINNAIGVNGKLPWHLPKDLEHFKSLTKNHVVIMGRKTWDSLPLRPLPNRLNLVLSRNKDTAYTGATRVQSPDEAIEYTSSLGMPELWVIGGSMVYEAFLHCADALIITHVHTQVNGDTFFPQFNTLFRATESNYCARDEQHKHSFTFTKYEKDH
jgi:dihydrofolate reductase